MKETKSYQIRDNGLRCFIPPCFSWDVIEIATGELTTVSDIDSSNLVNAGTQRALLNRLALDGPSVRGYFTNYQDPQMYQEGIRFTVTEVTGPIDDSST